MRSLLTHDLRSEPECRFEQRAGSFLAIVDVDSYPAFVSKKADRLDVVQHLSHEMCTLTAAMWEVPDAILRLHLIWAPDDTVNDRLLKSGRRAFAGGAVRTFGRLGIANDQQLLDRAHRPEGNLLRGGRNAPHLLLVPSGVYHLGVYGKAPRTPSTGEIEYTVVLAHHPHPAPRLQPVRLNGMLPFGRSLFPLDHPVATPDWCDSHKAPR